MTATQIDFQAISGTTRSIIYQSFTGTGASYTVSFWARAVTGTGTLYAYTFKDAASQMLVGASLTTTWQRFAMTGTLSADTIYLVIGADGGMSVQAQPITQPALSCYIWGVQIEQCAAATPYHKTVAASVSWSPGTPTTVGTPYYPLGFTGVNSKAVHCAGVADYYDLGNVSPGYSGFWGAIAFTYDATWAAGNADIIYKGAASNYEWFVYTTAGPVLRFATLSAAGAETDLEMATLELGKWNVLAWSYTPTTEDNCIVLANLNGTAYSMVNGKLIAAGTASLKLGELTGAVARCSMGPGTLTAAQLADIVASWQGTLASRG